MKIFFNSHGETRTIWVVLVIAFTMCLIMAIMVFAIKRFLVEPGCNQTGAEYGLSADYRFPADICFVELPNGKKIDAENLQGFEGVER